MTDLAPSPSLSALSIDQLKAQLESITFPDTPFTNWARTFHSLTTATFRPTTIDQVRRVVQLARLEGRELRPSGSGHSPSDIVCTDGYVVNLDALDKVVEINSTTGLAHVQGGMKLTSLNSHLALSNLALSSLGSISDQTIAGAISTSTHGSGVSFGSLSTFVRQLDIVLPVEGVPVVRVSREHDPDLFLSALCGLGTVGIIVGVVIQAEPRFLLEEETWSIRFEDFVDSWRDIAESAEHVRCWWFPQVGEVKVSRLNRTTKAITPPPSLISSYITDTFLSKHYHAVILTLSRLLPNILPYHAQFMYHSVHRPGAGLRGIWEAVKGIVWMRFPKKSGEVEVKTAKVVVVKDEGEGKTAITTLAPSDEATSSQNVANVAGAGKKFKWLQEPLTKVDWSVNIFNYDCGFPQYTYEGIVPYEKTREALLSLEEWETRNLHDRNGLRPHFPIEFRFTEKDDIWLSPTYGMRGTYIGTIQYRPFNLPVPYRTLFSEFESHLLAQGGRPHWAKSHTLYPEALGKLYDRFDDFLRVRERVDPAGVLLNPYTRRHLLGATGAENGLRRWKRNDRN
ncbi:L-gulonolactone/D-arabinono-1,4-lactone oxidase [Meredithblackwellia eburnea MCA 4105]